MHRALALAETVRGRTSPNPAVGAVILDATGHLAGEGATAAAGGPHAEVTALQRGRRRRPGRHGGGHPRAVRPHRPHRAVHRRAGRRRRGQGRLRRRRPEPRGRGRRAAAARGRRGRRGRRRGARRGERRAAALAARGAHRAAVRHLEVRRHPGRPGGRGRLHLALDLLGRLARRRARAAGRGRRDPGRQRHRAGRRPAADRARRRRPGRPPAAAGRARPPAPGATTAPGARRRGRDRSSSTPRCRSSP